MAAELIHVLVVDDHPIVLDGVTLALHNTSWLRVAGYARSGKEAIAALRTLRPDVVLLDLRLPDMLGPEAVQALRAGDPAVKVIMFTAYPDHAALDAALAAGAHGVVVKDSEPAELVDVIARVLAGERVGSVDGSVGTALNGKLREHGLTRREYDILRRVAMGETNPEIAAALGLTRNTVKTYLQRTLEKLGARNRVEALSRASQLGILWYSRRSEAGSPVGCGLDLLGDPPQGRFWAYPQHQYVPGVPARRGAGLDGQPVGKGFADGTQGGVQPRVRIPGTAVAQPLPQDEVVRGHHRGGRHLLEQPLLIPPAQAPVQVLGERPLVPAGRGDLPFPQRFHLADHPVPAYREIPVGRVHLQHQMGRRDHQR
ncbi:MAG: response regulator transcription factor, partial [Actinobacteria bacterium]